MALIDNLVSYWKLEEASGARADEVGGNTLTDDNTVTQAVGKLGNCGQFTRANSEQLSHVDNASLSVGDIDFTWAGWVYADTLTNNSGILGKWGTNNEYALWYYNLSSLGLTFMFSVVDGSGGTTHLRAASAGAPATGTWYYIVAWHDSVANTINIQVNNGTVDSTAHTTGVRDGTNAFSVGNYASGSAGIYWDGRIDSVGFWKRVLTAAERTSLYNSGAGLEYPFSSGVHIFPNPMDGLGSFMRGGNG